MFGRTISASVTFLSTLTTSMLISRNELKLYKAFSVILNVRVAEFQIPELLVTGISLSAPFPDKAVEKMTIVDRKNYTEKFSHNNLFSLS